ncbi:PREDICTED: uncharacterized protein LOC105460333, partial [Wasmannia auropunctata]|uniref:uncharacterized protein LOC105460333 n=1 Tax=Wasmannia auropunctata TaxID=64793 RepID=UPI0005F05636
MRLCHTLLYVHIVFFSRQEFTVRARGFELLNRFGVTRVNMVRCIVKSCPNKTEKSCKTEVSFFSLLKNDVIREGWLKKIGEVRLPLNIKNAKICSVHFTEQSFHVERRQKSRKCTNPRRLLLPNAFLTIMLSPTENRTNTAGMDFKVIRREFLLTANVHRSTDEGSSSNEKPSSTCRNFDVDDSLHPENASSDPLSVSETVVNIETPKSHRRKLWVEKRIFETPQSTSDAPDNVCNATFPR